MITKVKANKSFPGTTKYVLDKEKAKIIGGNMYGISTNQLVEQFTLSAHLNPHLKDPCYHLMLSVPKADRTLNDDELANLSQRHFANVIVLSRLQGDEAQVKQPDKRIADTKLKELVDEFIETQLPAYDFFIARHSDKEHDHTHIVASRVNNLDGKSIRTWNNYAHSEHSARLLEREFKLTQVQSSWESKQKAMTRNQLERVERDGLPGEEIMRRAIEQVAADKPTMPQLIERLWREHQVQSIVSYYGHGGVRGIKFGIDVGSVNEDGSPRLLWKQGGNLNKYKCSFTKLQTELGINYDPKQDDSEIKRLNNFLESVDNSQVYQQLISTILPKKTQAIAETKHQLNPDKSDAEQRASSELVNTISDFIEQSVVESTLIEKLPQLTEQLSGYQQNLSAVRTTYDELLAAITEREQLLSQRTVDAISDFIEQSIVESALVEAFPQLTEQLSEYQKQLANNKTTLDDLKSAIADVEQRLRSQRAVDAIANFIEQSAVESTLSETLPQLAEQLSQYNQQLSAGRTTFDNLLAAIALSEQLRSQRIVDAIANFIEQSTVESTLSETLPQLAEQLSQYRQQSDAGRTAFDELSSAITQELQSHIEKKAILSISDYIEQSTVESALTEAVLELTQQLSQYKEELVTAKTTFNDLDAVLATELQSYTEKRAISSISDYIEQSTVESALTEAVLELTQQLSQYKEELVTAKTTFNDLDAVLATELQSYTEKRAISSISDYIEQSTVESALTEAVLELTQQLSQYKEELVTAKATFNDLDAVLATELKSYLEKKAILSISDYIEQSTVESALTEAVLELTQRLSQYKEQLSAGRTTFDDLELVINTELQSHIEKKAILSISDYVEQSTVESALTETVLELTQQLSQYKEQLVIAKTTFNDLDAVLATELQSYLEKRAISSISDYVEQSTVSSALTETVLELTQQLSQSQQQLSAGRTIFDDLEAAIVYLDQLHRSQKTVDAIALNQTPTITTDEPKLKDNLRAELYEYYSADLQKLLVTDRDKEIAIRALLDDKPPQDVEEIIKASPAEWTQDEARELVLIASNQLATQKPQPEQSLTEKQRQESEFLAMAVPIAVKLINWQLRATGSNSLRLKRATLEKQGRELVFTHDERGEIFRGKDKIRAKFITT